MKKIPRTTCPICDSANQQEILSLQDLPIVSNILWDDRESALSAARGDICLSLCLSCGHIYNRSFNPKQIQYSSNYENSLNFSGIFERYAFEIANHLVNRYDLSGKNIVEVGCGKGDFIKQLCELGNNHGVGFDPGMRFDAQDDTPQVLLIPDYFSSQNYPDPIDFFCSRHTLEHIDEPVAFVKDLLAVKHPESGTIYFIEVPNMQFILDDSSVWDIIYEHFSYFSKSSLTYLFNTCGYQLLDVYDRYNGQFLCLEAASKTDFNRPIEFDRNNLQDHVNQVDTFSRSSIEKFTYWRNELDQLRRNNMRTVVWGAGSKGISFLNMLHVRDEIQYIIDINPRKKNKFITGTGQQIVAPEFLVEYQPDVIILMNPIYQSEVENKLAELGISAQVHLAI